MDKTLEVVFDGEVFRPVSVPELTPHAVYLIRVISQVPSTEERDEDAWDVLERMAGTVDGPDDWSLEHDHYLYGTPKRSGRPSE